MVTSDLVLYCAASRADDDSSLVGGAVDTAWRPLDIQFTSNAVVAVISDGADTRTVTVEGRLAVGGAVDTEVITLTGTTEAVGAKAWERILKLTLSATYASRVVTVRQGPGGGTRHSLNPNETGAVLLFRKSQANGSATRTYYEKYFWKNNSTSDLTSANDEETADVAALYDMGLAPSVGDSATAANRLTAPASVTFNTGPQNIPGGGTLAAGSAVGVWFRMSLAIAQPAGKDIFENNLEGIG